MTCNVQFHTFFPQHISHRNVTTIFSQNLASIKWLHSPVCYIHFLDPIPDRHTSIVRHQLDFIFPLTKWDNYFSRETFYSRVTKTDQLILICHENKKEKTDDENIIVEAKRISLFNPCIKLHVLGIVLGWDHTSNFFKKWGRKKG